jgi:GT2 family glycosyltransferase
MNKIDIVLVTYKDKEGIDIINRVSEIEFFGGYRNLIVTGINDSASVNRNYGLDNTDAAIVIMMDDDVTGFYQDWINDLVNPMLQNSSIIIASARLLNKNGTFGSMMGGNNIPKDSGIYDVTFCGYRNHKRICTACIAIRNNDVRFDEGFVGSGYEDTDYCNRISEKFAGLRMVVNNNCKLVHLNEEKNQGGLYWEHNKKYYLRLYPDDPTVMNQTDWTR